MRNVNVLLFPPVSITPPILLVDAEPTFMVFGATVKLPTPAPTIVVSVVVF